MREPLHIETTPEMAKNIASGIRQVAAKSNRHRSIAKMAKLTDYSGQSLNEAVSKLSDRERKDMLRAFAELDRVISKVAGA